MRLRILLSTSPDDDLIAEEPCEVITVVTEPLADHTAYYLVTAFAPTGEQRGDTTTFLGNATGYHPRMLAQLALQMLRERDGKERTNVTP